MSVIREQELAQEAAFANNVENSQIRLGVITAVDLGGEPYVSVQPTYNRRYLGPDGEVENTPAAVIEDVPLLYNSNQQYANWSPPAVGDTGILIGSDHAFDKWWTTGEQKIDSDNTRKRNRSDAFFLPAGWAKAKALGSPSEEWHEMRDMMNTLRVAISSTQGVHAQHEDWHLMLNSTGFDVVASAADTSLMEQLTKAFTAIQTCLYGLALTHSTNALGWQGSGLAWNVVGFTDTGAAHLLASTTSATNAALCYNTTNTLGEIIGMLEQIRGDASKIERDEAGVARP